MNQGREREREPMLATPYSDIFHSSLWTATNANPYTGNAQRTCRRTAPAGCLSHFYLRLDPLHIDDRCFGFTFMSFFFLRFKLWRWRGFFFFFFLIEAESVMMRLALKIGLMIVSSLFGLPVTVTLNNRNIFFMLIRNLSNIFII